MPTSSLTTLPIPLAEYFSAEDHATTAPLFAPDAIVKDEGEIHSGSAAIAGWLASVEARYHPRYVVESFETTGEHTVVNFIVSGTFPGSPARLRQRFSLVGDRIGSIETL